MTVTTSYPGVYIEELPSLVHSITPAPTSIAVFVGYTHPFLTTATDPVNPTTAPGPATLLFSFADYQTNFGGFFNSPFQPDYVGQAVYQFFLNRGPQCYVVSIPVQDYLSGTPLTSTGTAVAEATASSTQGSEVLTFTCLQPVGLTASGGNPAAGITNGNVSISNLSATGSTADIVITYANSVETYRKVAIGNVASALAGSHLVKVTTSGTAATDWSTKDSQPFAYSSAPDYGWTVIDPTAFANVFAAGASLDKVPVFNLLATPGITANAVTSECISYCENKRAFYIMDTPSSSPPPGSTAAQITAYDWSANNLVQDTASDDATLSGEALVSINAAVYYPWLQNTDPITGGAILSPPSGYVAGMYGQEDSNFGVWKSPAGIETALLGTGGVDPNGLVNDPQQGVLNLAALNCIRQFPGVGTVIFGARTTAGANANTAQQQWRYVAVRRTALFIEQSLYASLNWAVFQGNSQPLWDALAQETTAFMLSLFRQGAFAGTTPNDSFLVVCDSTTTTPTDVQNGTVNLLVGFAPLVPAEFVVIQIAQLAGQAQS